MEDPDCSRPPCAIGRRTDARLRLAVPATLVLVDGTFKSTLENVSRTGARVLLAGGDVRIEQSGFLRCRGLELFCTVVWSRGARCGVQFDELLGEEQLLDLRWYGDNIRSLVESEDRSRVRAWVGGQSRVL